LQELAPAFAADSYPHPRHEGGRCNGRLLFVVGVMNLLWVAVIGTFILLEKNLPQGLWESSLRCVVARLEPVAAAGLNLRTCGS